MKFPYDRTYSPPAPVIKIRVGVPGGKKISGELSAFVDTGADGTIIPVSYLAEFEIEPDSQRFLRSQWGDRRAVDAYLIDILIGSVHLSPIEIVTDELGEEIIIGRNVLNKLVVTLDGPKRILEIIE